MRVPLLHPRERPCQPSPSELFVRSLAPPSSPALTLDPPRVRRLGPVLQAAPSAPAGMDGVQAPTDAAAQVHDPALAAAPAPTVEHAADAAGVPSSQGAPLDGALQDSATLPVDPVDGSNATAWTELPTYEEQLRTIREYIPLYVGDTWYALSAAWRRTWESHCLSTGSTPAPGPIDNSNLVSTNGRFSTYNTENVDFTFVHERHWQKLVHWYGYTQEPIARRVITIVNSRGTATNVIEAHPLRFVVALSTNRSATHDVVISKVQTYNDLRTAACQALGVDPERSRLWTVVAGSRDRVITNLSKALNTDEANAGAGDIDLIVEVQDDNGEWTEQYVPPGQHGGVERGG